MSEKPTRHLLGLSGGKDSAALAIYMRDRVPDMEYFFADTGAELPETLEFIEKNGGLPREIGCSDKLWPRL
jgi:3'-phosphoadenosine 5'-phosphosulfate sulfotransferase (PAPS reductase)/FAD synthetase